MGYDEWKAEQNQASGQGSGEKKRGRPKKEKDNSVGKVVNIAVGEQELENINLTEKIWEFNDVIAVKKYDKEEAMYVLTLDIYTLGKMYSKQNGIIFYDPSTQRGSKIGKNNEEISIHRPAKIKQIINCILSDEWDGGTIILNAPINETEIEYDTETKTLRGHGRLTLVDGNHRTLAFRQIAELFDKGKIVQDPRDYQITVQIHNTDWVGAAKIFSEHGLLSLAIPKTRGMFLNVENLENLIVRRLMKESELKSRIETISSQPKGNNVVSFGILTESVKNNLAPKTKEEANVLADHLIKYVDYLVNLYPEILGNIPIETRKENKLKNLAGEQMFISAIIASMPVLVGRDDMYDRLKSLRNIIKVDNWEGEVLDRNFDLWQRNILINSKIINKKSTQKFVTQTIKEYLTTGKLPVEYELVKEYK